MTTDTLKTINTAAQTLFQLKVKVKCLKALASKELPQRDPQLMKLCLPAR